VRLGGRTAHVRSGYELRAVDLHDLAELDRLATCTPAGRHPDLDTLDHPRRPVEPVETPTGALVFGQHSRAVRTTLR
jgi:hypothetical protein